MACPLIITNPEYNTENREAAITVMADTRLE